MQNPITRAQVLALLRDGHTEVRVGDNSEDLLRTLCGMLGLRKHSKVECGQLQDVLLMLAARGSIRLEFESDESDRIIAVILPDETSDAQIARLRAENSGLRDRVNELLRTIKRHEDDMSAVDELVADAVAKVDAQRGEAEQRFVAASAALNDIEARFTEAATRVAATIRARDNTIAGLERQLRGPKAAHGLPGSNRRFGATTVHLAADIDEQPMGCGCVIRRLSGVGCVHGGAHSYVTVAVTDDAQIACVVEALVGMAK